MLREYIATFHSHFGAARFHKEKVKEGKKAYLQPVPRDLSSSCGTAVHFYVEDNGKSEPLSIKEAADSICTLLFFGFRNLIPVNRLHLFD